MTEAAVGSGKSRVYLHQEVLISNRDIQGTSIIQDKGRRAVALYLKKEASDRLQESKALEEGRIIAILLNGHVAAAPQVRAAGAPDKLEIPAESFQSEEDALRTAKGITGQL